jgi:hypothetical protein
VALVGVLPPAAVLALGPGLLLKGEDPALLLEGADPPPPPPAEPVAMAEFVPPPVSTALLAWPICVAERRLVGEVVVQHADLPIIY